MAKTVCRVLLGLVVLYAAAVTAFAFLHYEDAHPGAFEVLADFHAWLGLGAGAPPPPPPPPAAAEPPPAPLPPPPPPAAPATTAEEEAPLDTVEETLRRAETEAKGLRDMARGPEFQAKLREVLGLLGTCREALGQVLDARPDSARANRLWDRLQALDAAVKHL